MNRGGIAVAAAGCEHIFSIAPRTPVAIVVPSDTMMGVPWQTIVETFASELGERTFGTIDDYAGDFFDFIERTNALFPAQTQADYFRRCIESVWSGYRDRIETTGVTLDIVIAEDRRHLLAAADIPGLGEAFGKYVVDSYASELAAVEADVFAGMKPARALRAQLHEIVALMFGKDWSHAHDDNCIAICGMGNDEPFPSTLAYAVGSVVAGRVRRVLRHAVRIGLNCDAGIMPLGERDTIDTIVEGIHPDLLAMARELRPNVLEFHSSPFLTNLADLSRSKLVKLAEALVRISSIDQPIDVALLTPSSGFAWQVRS
ncbi:MAG TPA: hypothetical protein VGF18_06385 [Candidatus Tumulicola sp.]